MSKNSGAAVPLDASLTKRPFSTGPEEMARADGADSGGNHHQNGHEHARAGRWRQALREFEKAARYQPDHPEFHYMRGIALSRLNRLDEAVDAFKRELTIEPKHPPALAEIGICLAKTGRTRESIPYLLRGLGGNPHMAVAQFTLGLALLTENRRKEAIKAFNHVLALHGAYADVYRLRGLAYAMDGADEKAADDLQAAAAIDSKNYRAMLSQGMKFGKKEDYQAGYLFETAAKAAPKIALPQFIYGQFLLISRRYELGLKYVERAIELDPLQAQFHLARGFGLLGQGRIEESVTAYRHARELDPTSAQIAGDMLFVLQHKVGITKAELLEAHKTWAALARPHLPKDRLAFANDPNPQRRLRIGLVSADLHRHAVARLTLRAFEQLGALGYEIFCYKTDRRRQDDDYSERYKAVSKSWRDVSDLDDQALTALIAEQEIDILFDLAGQTSGHRLPVFAMRAAPVQLSWAGYVGTLGLDTYDGLIADPIEIPLADDEFYTEPVIRLPDCYVCYDPSAEAPEVGPLPFLQKGTFTFGCFNRPAKLNAEVGRAWSKILDRVPNARILMVYGGLNEQSTKDAVYKLLESGGLSRDRVDLIGEGDHLKLLEAYSAKVDLALDPFPYSAGVTTLEAMWMGVPTVTLVGQTFAGRHSATHLTAAGLADFCTDSIEAYIDLAVDWASQPEALAALRAGLRQKVAASPLNDPVRFGHHLDAALTRLWQDWCNKRLAASGA